MCLYHSCVGIAHDHRTDDGVDEYMSDHSVSRIETYGHSAVRSGTLNGTIMSKIRNKKIVDLLGALLKIDENERMKIDDVIKHEWFAAYYKKEQKRIHRRSKSQTIKYLESMKNMEEIEY